jgi:HK97 family phage prohead protease
VIHVRSFDITADGRTLEGVAYYYDRASRVTDDGRTFYLEAIGRGADTKTVRERPQRPLFRNHRRSEDPIGAVGFEASADALLFRARLSKTRAADEVLELVNDGAMRDASVGFLALATSRRPAVDGIVHVRTEIAIRELSVAPTGFGLHQGAGVLAVRSDHQSPNRLEASRRRLRLLDLNMFEVNT